MRARAFWILILMLIVVTYAKVTVEERFFCPFTARTIGESTERTRFPSDLGLGFSGPSHKKEWSRIA